MHPDPASQQQIHAASAHLRRGQPLLALGRIGHRTDPHGLALRGIALAQLGEFVRAKTLLTEARLAFVQRGESLWAAKAMAALAEVGFATRDLDIALHHLDAGPLRAGGDLVSAAYVEVLQARLYALLGRPRTARRILSGVSAGGPAAALAGAELLAADGCFAAAADAAATAAADGTNLLLAGESARLAAELRRPAFVLRRGGGERRLALVELEAETEPYVDTIRRKLGEVDLRRRVALLELLTALARGPVTAAALFGRSSDSLMVRLRMEVSRARQVTGLEIRATAEGFVCVRPLGLLLPAVDGIEAVLADGESWPPRALAAVLGDSLRTVERRLAEHSAVEATGLGRARRYRLRSTAPGIATRLLLLARTGRG